MADNYLVNCNARSKRPIRFLTLFSWINSTPAEWDRDFRLNPTYIIQSIWKQKRFERWWESENVDIRPIQWQLPDTFSWQCTSVSGREIFSPDAFSSQCTSVSGRERFSPDTFSSQWTSVSGRERFSFWPLRQTPRPYDMSANKPATLYMHLQSNSRA